MSYVLCDSDIDAASEEAFQYLQTQKLDSKEITRIRLNVEDTLIRFQEFFGKEHAFTLKCGKFLGKIRITISVKGEMYDPFNAVGRSPEEDNRFMRTVLSQMGDLPQWRYGLGTNSVTIGLTRKSTPDWTHLIIAIIAAIVIGAAINITQADLRESFNEVLLTPVLDTFMGFLSAMAGPMIFLEIVWGIYSIGDAATFSVLGKRLVGRYLVYYMLFTAVLGLVMVPLFNLVSTESQGLVDFGPLLEMILAIVPSNLFAPFINGNTLQILFVAIIVGLAMLFVSEKTATVAVLIEQLEIIVQIIMDVISKLVPFFVFGCLLQMIVSDQLSQVAVSYKLLITNLVGTAFILFVSIGIVCIKTKTNFGVFLRKMFPTFIIGLTTASSAAAFATNRKTCSDDYGIRPGLADFGVPFGQVIYKPTVALLYFTSCICLAEIFGVETSTQWFVSVFIISIILSIATAPLPGSTLASLTMLFTQLGIPADGIAIVLALNIVLDFIETPTDLVGGQCLLVLAADRFSMIDKDVLRSSSSKAK